MRIIPVAAMLALLLMPHSASSNDRAKLEVREPKAASAKMYTAEESASMGRAVRAKAEAQERIWDRKMKLLMRSICTGC